MNKLMSQHINACIKSALSNTLKSLVVVIALCCPTFGSSQVTLDSLFSCDVLISELDSLKQTIVESHPDPYAFCGKEAFDRVFEDSKLEIDTAMSVRDFTVIAARCLGVMQDSHSSLDYGQLTELQFGKEGYVMPMALQRVQSSAPERSYDLVAERDWQNELPKGARVLSINGNDIDSLYALSLAYSCIEGSAESAKSAVAAAILPVVSGLHFPSDSINTIEVIPFNSDSVVTIELKGYKEKEYKRIRKARGKMKINEWINVSYDDERSLAVLKVATFAPPNSRHFKKTVHKAFRDIHKNDIENVVIDLRNNGGGSSGWVEYLYSFLDDEGYNTPSNVIGKNSEIAMDRAHRFNHGFAKFIIKVFLKNDEDVQSFQHFAQMPWGDVDTLYFHDRTRQKRSLVFEGRSFLLINGLTASAGVDFTNAFRSHQRGTIVGESCLGPVTGTWGNPAHYTLPYTKLRVTVATIRYNYDNSFAYERNPIEPDHHVSTTAEDLFNGRDAQLEFVKELIDKK